jgi:hypothetical protein
MTDQQPRCENCRFWKAMGKDGAVNRGFCRRYPPISISHEDQEGVWPDTFEYHWCGEWQENP